MKILALVTAKSQSTRVPHKNKALLHGKPLYKWTTDFIDRYSDFFHAVVFSSDKPLDFNLPDYWFRTWRSDYLIADSTPHIESVKHALFAVENKTGVFFDGVMLFQPTNPVRDVKLLHHAFHLAERYIKKGPITPYYQRCAYVDKNLSRKYIHGASFPEEVNKNGPPTIFSGSLYTYSRDYLRYGGDHKPMTMMVDKQIGYNINDGTDLLVTEAFMKEIGVPYGY